MDLSDLFVLAIYVFCAVWALSLSKQKKKLDQESLDAKKKQAVSVSIMEIVKMMDATMANVKHLTKEVEHDKEINDQLTKEVEKLREEAVLLAKDNIFLRSMSPSAEGKKLLYDSLNKEDVLLHFSYISDVVTHGYLETKCSLVLHPLSGTFSLYRESVAVLQHEPMASVPALMRWIDADAILDKLSPV